MQVSASPCALVAGGTILGTSYVHRHHHHARHQQRQQQQQQFAASSGSNGSSSGSAVSDTDEDDTTRLAETAAAAWDDQDTQLEAILDKLDFWRINILCVIGGQGGNQLGAQLAAGCQRRSIPCCVVGVPKSIDNDVMLVDKTFGFDTVVQVSWCGMCLCVAACLLYCRRFLPSNIEQQGRVAVRLGPHCSHSPACVAMHQHVLPHAHSSSNRSQPAYMMVVTQKYFNELSMNLVSVSVVCPCRRWFSAHYLLQR